MQDIARQGQYYHKGTTLQQGTTNKNYEASAPNTRREKVWCDGQKRSGVSGVALTWCQESFAVAKKKLFFKNCERLKNFLTLRKKSTSSEFVDTFVNAQLRVFCYFFLFRKLSQNQLITITKGNNHLY